MSKNRAICHLIISVNSIKYVLGTLRFNNGEFSYFFHNDSSGTFLNLDTGEVASPLDHCTWHKNSCHIKTADGTQIDPIHFKDSLLCDPPVLTPLYVESIYFDDLPPLVRLENFQRFKGSHTQEIIRNAQKGFSVIFMLSPSEETLESILSGFQFSSIPQGFLECPRLEEICSFGYRVGRIQVWDSWDIVVITTPLTRKIQCSIDFRFGNAFRLPNYKNIPAALTDLMIQAGIRNSRHEILNLLVQKFG